MTINTVCVFGTRPEAIKMASLIKCLDNNPAFRNKVCVTGQHKEMLDPILKQFDIIPDFNLQVMESNQNLSDLTSKILTGLQWVFKNDKPDLVFVQGDTTTTFTTALSAHYHHIPIAHIEAGLRTGNLNLPWPEEGNRKLATALSTLHFAPTPQARLNLLHEGISDEFIYITGNTVIDTLYDVLLQLETQTELLEQLRQQFAFLTPARKMILVTGHRRESFGRGFERICQALATLAQRFPMIDIVYPVHLNPQVQIPVKCLLKDIKNIYLIEPVDYLPFVYLMQSAHLILTDSGGIQEEAPALGKPVLIMRDKTERPEAIAAGTAKLVGTDVHAIVKGVEMLLTNTSLYQHMSQAKNPYGDGTAAAQIVHNITEYFRENSKTAVGILSEREVSY